MQPTQENIVKGSPKAVDLSLSEFHFLLHEYDLTIDKDAVLSPVLKVKPEGDRKKLETMGLFDKGSDWLDVLMAVSSPDFQINSVLTSSHTRISSWKYANRSNSDLLVECWQEDERVHISFPVEYQDIGSKDFIALDIDNAPSPYISERQFSPDGFLAFVAAVDIIRVVILSSILQRQVITDFSLSEDELDAAIELSVNDQYFDSRWMVTLLRMFAPETCIPSGMKILKRGLKELINLKLIKKEEENRWSPTDELINIASNWISPLPAIHHEIITTHLDGSKDIKNSLTLRGNGPLTLVDFDCSNEKEPKIIFRPMEASLYWMEMTGRMIPSEIDKKYKVKSAVSPSKTMELKCTKCGESILSGQKFCTNCGTPVIQKVELPPKKQELERCPECDAELLSNAKFCNKCGAKVKKGM